MSVEKSHVVQRGPYPYRADLTMLKLFQEGKKAGASGELIFVDSSVRWNVQQVWERADAYAKGMLAIGMSRGDTLSVVACISQETAALFLAALSIGVGYSVKPKLLVVGEGMQGETISTLIELMNDNPKRFSYIEYMYYDCTSNNNRTVNEDWLKPLESLISSGASVTDEELQRARDAVEPSDPGSTGTPKCIVHTHNGCSNELYSLCSRTLEPIVTTSVNLDEVSSYSGISMVLAGFCSKAVIGPDMDEFRLMEQLVGLAEVIRAEGVVHIGTTSAYTAGWVHLVKNEGLEFPDCKTALLGGQIFSDHFRQDITKTLGVLPYNLYGMSEFMHLGISPMDENEEALKQRMKGLLKPKFNSELKIVDDFGKVVPIGTEGEIWSKSFCLLKEYKNSDPSDREKLVSADGFIKSGDMGVMYEGGVFEVKGRKSDSIRFKICTEVVYPGPIENAMSKHPAVKDIGVISVNVNDWFGDEIIFCICLNEGVKKPTEDELMEHLLIHLDEMKRPCKILYLDKLPRTNNSRKVSKKKLRDQVKQMLSKDPTLGNTKWFTEMSSVAEAAEK